MFVNSIGNVLMVVKCCAARQHDDFLRKTCMWASAVVTARANAKACCGIVYVCAWCAAYNVCAVKVCLVVIVLGLANNDVLRAICNCAAIVSGVR